jgi:hypothetical protein
VRRRLASGHPAERISIYASYKKKEVRGRLEFKAQSVL